MLSYCNTQENRLPKEKIELVSQKMSWTDDLTIILKTKFDSEVVVKYDVQYRGQLNIVNLEKSLNKHINKEIIDSLHHFDMYEMWTSRRDTMEFIMGRLIKNNYSKVEQVQIHDVIIPEDAEKLFIEREESRHAIIDALFENGDKLQALAKEIESNLKLSKSEVTEIEKEIRTLENERAMIKKKGKLLTLELKR